MTVTAAIARVIRSLNASSAAELILWTEAELYGWMSEALGGISRRVQLFAEERTEGTPPVQPTQVLDPLDLAVMHCAWGSRSLRPITLAGLDALDDAWTSATPDAALPPKFFAPDYQGVAQLRLYPPPAGAAPLHTITLRTASVSSGAPTIAAPEVLGDYLEAKTLQAARARQGDGGMPEVARDMGAFADMIEATMRAYYGGSQ